MTNNPYSAPKSTETLEPPKIVPNSEDRLWASLAHLSYFILPVFGTLLIWVMKKDASPFVDDQAKEALNFHLTLLIGSFVFAITLILIPLVFGMALAAFVFAIVAAIEANKGKQYRYPWILRLIK